MVESKKGEPTELAFLPSVLSAVHAADASVFGEGHRPGCDNQAVGELG